MARSNIWDVACSVASQMQSSAHAVLHSSSHLSVAHSSGRLLAVKTPGSSCLEKATSSVETIFALHRVKCEGSLLTVTVQSNHGYKLGSARLCMGPQVSRRLSTSARGSARPRRSVEVYPIAISSVQSAWKLLFGVATPSLQEPMQLHS